MVTRLHDEEAIFRREIADAEHEIEELNIFCMMSKQRIHELLDQRNEASEEITFYKQTMKFRADTAMIGDELKVEVEKLNKLVHSPYPFPMLFALQEVVNLWKVNPYKNNLDEATIATENRRKLYERKPEVSQIKAVDAKLKAKRLKTNIILEKKEILDKQFEDLEIEMEKNKHEFEEQSAEINKEFESAEAEEPVVDEEIRCKTVVEGTIDIHSDGYKRNIDELQIEIENATEYLESQQRTTMEQILPTHTEETVPSTLPLSADARPEEPITVCSVSEQVASSSGEHPTENETPQTELLNRQDPGLRPAQPTETNQTIAMTSSAVTEQELTRHIAPLTTSTALLPTSIINIDRDTSSELGNVKSVDGVQHQQSKRSKTADPSSNMFDASANNFLYAMNSSNRQNTDNFFRTDSPTGFNFASNLEPEFNLQHQKDKSDQDHMPITQEFPFSHADRAGSDNASFDMGYNWNSRMTSPLNPEDENFEFDFRFSGSNPIGVSDNPSSSNMQSGFLVFGDDDTNEAPNRISNFFSNQPKDKNEKPDKFHMDL